MTIHKDLLKIVGTYVTDYYLASSMDAELSTIADRNPSKAMSIVWKLIR